MKTIRIIPRLDVKGPNLVKGIHLEGLRVLGNPNDFANYIVVSKFFDVSNNLNIDLNFGYAFDISKYTSIAYRGFFGGIKIKHNSFNKLSLSAEHDSKNFIFGAKLKLLNNLEIMGGVWDFDKPTFAFNYSF